MKRLRVTLAAGIVAAALGSITAAHSSQDTPKPAATADDLSGLHGFDFEFGEWRVHHRVKRPTGEWWEFDGTCNDRPLMDGFANIEQHTFNKPNGVAYGVALRAYDRKTAQWAIWWVDSRVPHGPLDPPVKGAFDAKGVGTFYSDYMDHGKPMRLRFIWSHITRTTARWEQASSADAGKTWDTNWIMEFQRGT